MLWSIRRFESFVGIGIGILVYVDGVSFKVTTRVEAMSVFLFLLGTVSLLSIVVSKSKQIPMQTENALFGYRMQKL